MQQKAGYIKSLCTVLNFYKKLPGHVMGCIDNGVLYCWNLVNIIPFCFMATHSAVPKLFGFCQVICLVDESPLLSWPFIQERDEELAAQGKIGCRSNRNG